MSFVIKPQTYTCRNYEPRGVGFVLDGTGVPILQPAPADPEDPPAFIDFTIQANIQPFTGQRRNALPDGAVTEDRVKGYIMAVAGVFPTLYAGNNALDRLATRLTYKGGTYEVQVVKDDFTDGLVPYLYFEATLLVAEHYPNAAGLTGSASFDDVVW